MSARRLWGLSLLVAPLHVACDAQQSGPTVATIPVRPSTYVTVDPVSVTSSPAPPPRADGRSPVEQLYVVASANDVPIRIAEKFDVELEALREYNGWGEDYANFPGVGGTVRIPPNAKLIDAAASSTPPGATAGSTD